MSFTLSVATRLVYYKFQIKKIDFNNYLKSQGCDNVDKLLKDKLDEIKNYTFLNNTIANVSSCIIKKGDYTEVYEEAGSYRQSGDWVFYINIMSKGKVAYVDKIMNYYRVHGSQITSQMNKQKHFDEIQKVYEYINEKFGVSEFQTEKRNERCEFLKRVWQLEYNEEK